MSALWITLLLSLFMVVGAIIIFFTKNNEKFVTFSISFAASVMAMMILTDLWLESYEAVKTSFPSFPVITQLAFIFLGFLLLFGLDQWIPDHEDDLSTHQDDAKNLRHIGVISAIALILHNMIEGAAIYLLARENMQLGWIATLGVGLHNLPLGMVLASMFYQASLNKGKTLFLIFLISLSTFGGGLGLSLLQLESIPVMFEAVTLSITIGMLLFIILVELLPKIVHTEHKSITVSGLVCGVIIMLLASLIG